jgi:CubicO group peptidase (beta-lactamase class C family)
MFIARSVAPSQRDDCDNHRTIWRPFLKRGTMAAPAATPSGKLGDAIELAWKQQRDADASGPAMELGWMIAVDGQTRWHNGQTGGSRSALFINRELNCTVVVLCNTAVTDAVDRPSIKRPLFTAFVTRRLDRKNPAPKHSGGFQNSSGKGAGYDHRLCESFDNGAKSWLAT